MNGNRQSAHQWPNPFGLGWQGYFIIAVIILGTGLFAATRRDWTSMIISALTLPLLMIALIHVVSGFWRSGPRASNRRRGDGQELDLLTFLARTNPFMFLLFGALSRGTDDDRYRELLQSGPYGMGQYGYLVVLVIILAPLMLALILTATTGRLPS